MMYRFAGCELDPVAHSLRCGGRPVHVEPQVFDLLLVLSEHGEALVGYDLLIERVWGGRIVSDATLAGRIASARRAVNDDGRRQSVIRTVNRRGVQMAVPVERVMDAAGGAAAGQVPGRPGRPHQRQVIRFARSRDGTRIAWAESGEGAPLLRAGHWLSHLERDWDSPVWRPLLDRLSERGRLIRYDPRGTGLSQRDCAEITLDRLADDLEAVADAAGLHRFPIFAVSQSVAVAVVFAARHPDRVERLILMGGFVRGSAARGAGGETAAMVQLVRSGWGDPASPFMQAFSTLYMPAAGPAEIASFVEMQLASAHPDMAARIREFVAGIDISGLLDRVHAPTLVLHARGDAVQPVEEGRRLAAALRDAVFREFDARSHIPLPSEPAWSEMLDAAEWFLDQAPPQDPTSCS
ncbi:MAG: alpha/beta fold hydrolase [Tranquillimonas sp.]